MAVTDILGIGNAIVDVLAHADDAFLERHGMAKGTMNLIDEQRAEALYAEMDSGMECSGGSAANSMVGVASLGGSSAYIGKVREDGLGRVFQGDIRKAGVAFHTAPATSGPSTARSLILVTPDAQRTMNTYLGASATLATGDIDPKIVGAARITFLEGYLWDPEPAKQAFLEAAGLAHEAGRKVALSLSDTFCVDRHRDEFRDLVDSHVDYLFGNEDEIIALYQAASFEEAVGELRGRCELSAITRGARGSVVVTPHESLHVEAEPAGRVVDTTGAGDLYAAGFLFGLSRDLAPASCARIGGIAAAEIISHFGARPETSLRELVEGRLGISIG